MTATQEENTRRWSSNTDVMALYNFRGASSEDLSFVKKEVLTIVKRTRDPMWYLARNQDGLEGMIPANYVKELDPVPRWFHGKITRQQAEEMLLSHESGLFLVRESTNYPGDYTLCVCADNRVEHYHIVSKDTKFTIDEEEHFETLSQLVEHYGQNSDGLCAKLSKPCARRGGHLNITLNTLRKQGWAIKDSEVGLGKSEATRM